ncbi:DMT family transporter [Natranaerofaba carboxydovora]|uniref:DMT family transporter n=1 Tax=Natranaerofaba carboxydovora TaxID=2742683 RepID=UPI001F139284|nr:DMT family transporter [Natranaerofaba carboxydovora]UMZ73431.1 EamA-like transporter family protein [Natranaerofaba carboxydovora]
MMNQRQGIIVTSIAAAGFGSTTIFAQLAYNYGANVITLLTFRFGIAGILFLLALYLTRTPWNLKLNQLLNLIGLGVIGYAFFTTLYFYGVSLIPASLAGFLLSIYPIVVCVVAYLLGDEIMTPSKVFALLTSKGGLLFVLGPAFEDADPIGIVAVLLAAGMYSLYIVGSNRMLKSVHWLPGSAVITISSGVSYLTGGLITNQLSLSISREVIYSGIGLAVLSTFLAIGGFYLGLSVIGPAKASIVSTLEPVVTAFLAALIFNERLTIGQFIGGSFIILAIIILQRAREERHLKKDTPATKGPYN